MVLRVASPPSPEEIDKYVSARAEGTFTPLEDLTDHFYTVLAELHAQTRTWEQSAPATERMHPPLMAPLWQKAQVFTPM